MANRPHGEIVGEGENKDHRPNRPAGGTHQVRNAESANDHQNDEHGNLSGELECVMAEMRHQEPRAHGAQEAKGRLGHPERVSVVGGQANLGHK